MSKYSFTMKVRLSDLVGTEMHKIFPDIEDLVVNSAVFTDFQTAVDSVNGVVTELAATLNAGTERFKVASEINPTLSGAETISKDWSVGEVAKLWVTDTTKPREPSGAILSVALAQLVEVHQDDGRILN